MTQNRVIGALAVVVVLLLLLHDALPGLLGFAADGLLPWTGLLVAALVVWGLVRRGLVSLALVAVSLVAWAVVFGPTFLSSFVGTDTTRSDLVVLSQNLRAQSGSGPAAAREILASGADVVVAQELDYTSATTLATALKKRLPYTYEAGSVGIASRYPIEHGEELKMGQLYNRALRADVRTPQGIVRVYDVHLSSVRGWDVADRDQMASRLRAVLEADHSPRIVIAGDFNANTQDDVLSWLQGHFTEQKHGFGFTWPSALPAVRLDHLFTRGMTGEWSRKLARIPSDHRGIVSGLDVK